MGAGAGLGLAPALAPALATTGYEGLVQEALFDRLEAAGVRVLIDLRAIANSRKAGFSKGVLAASAAARGIGYVHIRALGTPKAGRQAARAGRADEMAAIFGAHLATEAAQAGLHQAREIALGAPSCLLCFERDPHFCHRRIVAEAIADITGQAVIHL